VAEPLLDVLGVAQTRGLLGPGPVEDQISHSRALADLIGAAPRSFLDLGSGGGIPGLVLALDWRDARGTFLDAHLRACTFLEQAVSRLGVGDRITVACGRAEELAREPDFRGRFELVVARLFGPPAVTAECAVGFLRPGGRLAVSEPPGSRGGRWEASGIAKLGLSGPMTREADGVTAAMLKLNGPLADRWPRPTGIPAKRPLW
jgi:16S rRNA (guanine527-N7)-methyltransferase